MKDYLNITFCVLILFITSCDKKDSIKSDKGIMKIEVRNAINSEGIELALSELGRELSYLPLETSELCLISNVTNLVFTKDYILITDSKELFQFSRSGKFLRKIGKLGKGPGEHGTFIKFAVDDSNEKEIFILNHPYSVNVYDLHSGTFKRDFSVSQRISGIAAFPNGYLSLFTEEINPMGSKLLLNEVYLADIKGNLIDSIIDYNRNNNKNSVIGGICLSASEDNILFNCYGKDTLYSLNSDFFKTTYASFEMKNKIKWEELIVTPDKFQELSDRLSLYSLTGIENRLFIEVIKGISRDPNDIFKIIFEKDEGKTMRVRKIINNIDAGLPFWPKWSNNSNLIDVVYPYQIFEYLDDTNDKSKFSVNFPELNNLKITDNPVIVILK